MNLEGLSEEQLAAAFNGADVNAMIAQRPAPQTSTPSPEQTEPQEQLPSFDDGLAFKDPVEMLFFLDDDISSGRVKLHWWQVQFMEDFACNVWTHEKPFQALVRAANGSGKDKYVIAACAVWLCMRYLKAWSVVTSSSGIQLDNQTCKHISHLCAKANAKIHPSLWKINYRHYLCRHNDQNASPIDCFATDEPGKAEGWHPIDAGCKLALFMSEAKTVTDEINEAYDRCDGYTHRVHVSSPGPPRGHFFSDDRRAISRKELKHIAKAPTKIYVKYVVSAFDCSHISRTRIEMMVDKYGEKSPLVQSSIFAEFSTEGEQVVIPYHYILDCYERPAMWVPEPFNTGGLDLADGGDETVLIVRNGNKVLKIIPFRLNKSYETRLYLNQLFTENGLNHPSSFIFADCGGLGKPILDELKNMGWSNICYIDNRHAANDKRVYYKLATEMWFATKKLFELRDIILPHDEKLKEQLSGRYYKIRPDNTLHLLSKQEQKAKGYASPDRADSLVLAYANYKTNWKEPKEDEDKNKPPFQQPPPAPPVSEFSINEWAKRDTKPMFVMTSPYRTSEGEFDIYKDEIRRYNTKQLERKINE